jgi:hypothetical protein
MMSKYEIRGVPTMGTTLPTIIDRTTLKPASPEEVMARIAELEAKLAEAEAVIERLRQQIDNMTPKRPNYTPCEPYTTNPDDPKVEAWWGSEAARKSAQRGIDQAARGEFVDGPEIEEMNDE